jgi:hypothetical protein
MKAILVVSVPVCHVDVSSENTAAGPSLDGFQSAVSPRIGTTTGRLESPAREQAVLPFWTWFIENPRARGAA